MEKLSGSLILNTIRGKEIRWFVVNESDHVQHHHAHGRFYEQKELDLIAQYLPEGAHFVDIGANVGNHTVFVHIFKKPKSLIVFEPSPEAISLLKANLALNAVEVDTSKLGIGVSDEATVGTMMRGSVNNLGASKVKTGTGDIPLDKGDNLLKGRIVDFIKIDVEGMEVKVLRGLADTVKQHRPLMYVEVDDKNAAEFKQWCADSQYAVLTTHRIYERNENYMISPVEKTAPQ